MQAEDCGQWLIHVVNLLGPIHAVLSRKIFEENSTFAFHPIPLAREWLLSQGYHGRFPRLRFAKSTQTRLVHDGELNLRI